MNNLTFGDSEMGYYETIAGGAGAGPGWHGRSGVHTHMTNTRITDPEILERRFPVVLHAFCLRDGSGGAGQWQGGEGVVREVHTCACAHACACRHCVVCLCTAVMQLIVAQLRVPVDWQCRPVTRRRRPRA